MVGASLEIMDRDSRRMRGNQPFLYKYQRRFREWIVLWNG